MNIEHNPLINMKNISLCTICLFISMDLAATSPHAPLDGVKQKMKYSQIRSILIDHGWQAVYNHIYYTEYISERDIHMLEINGWHEVDSCAGTGAGFCKFDFVDVYNNKLSVTTIGDCYNDEGLPAMTNEKCDLDVIHWIIKEK